MSSLQSVRAQNPSPASSISSPPNKTPTVKLYSPFIYSVSDPSSANGTQGIKQIPGPGQRRYVITGTYGNITTSGQGTVYVGAIDGATTSQGSGSGIWTLMNVPSSWGSTSTAIYGPGAIKRGNGPGGISAIELTGTYAVPINDGSSVSTRGFVYKGPLTATPSSSDFQSFIAQTPQGQYAYDTFLHSWSGNLIAGNYTLTNSTLAITLNAGIDSSAFVVDPITQQQRNLRYNDGSTSHTAFGIWYNGRSPWNSNKDTYTIAGGSSVVNPAVNKIGKVGQALGAATLVDYDPLTGNITNQRNYQYNNDTSNSVVTHFEGIFYAGRGIYQMPFVAASSTGVAAGNAYVKRLRSGQFSRKAIWQTFSSDQGTVTSNDSTAGLGATGLINNGSAVVPFSSAMTMAAYNQLLTQAQSLV